MTPEDASRYGENEGHELVKLARAECAYVWPLIDLIAEMCQAAVECRELKSNFQPMLALALQAHALLKIDILNFTAAIDTQRSNDEGNGLWGIRKTGLFTLCKSSPD